jgi:hypothetical protein
MPGRYDDSGGHSDICRLPGIHLTGGQLQRPVAGAHARPLASRSRQHACKANRRRIGEQGRPRATRQPRATRLARDAAGSR